MSDPDAIDGLPLPEHRARVVGHHHVFAAIADQLTRDRLPGAFLLHGPQGIGKATLAFALIRHILSATGDEDSLRVDEQIAAGSHPNVAVLRRQTRDTGKGFYTVIRVEDVRRLRDSLHMTRGRAGHRIAVIDTIDDCNPSAANALLKTLEEPPPDTTFFLISHRPGQLLPTIKSRCHAIALRPIADNDVETVLLSQFPGQAAAIAEAATLAGGRPRRGFEALALDREGALSALRNWLTNPADQPSAIHIGLADTLGASAQSPELSFAREIITDWLATEARTAALDMGRGNRLASANTLWEKAHALFEEADALNLDMKQTLVSILDAIKSHAENHAPRLAELQ